MADLPFEITARAVGKTMIMVIARVDGAEVTSDRYPIGSGKRRREVAASLASDPRLCNGICALPVEIERRLEELEFQITQKIDERDEEMEALASSAGEFNEPRQNQRGPSHATQLVDLVLHVQGLELWHDADGNAFATISIGDHLESWPIRSTAFRRWASRIFYDNLKKVPGGQALQDALTTLEGHAVHDGQEHTIHVRLAFIDDVGYLDLCDADWQVVEIRPTGWRVTTNPPLKFRRPRGVLPLPIPVGGGDIRDLRRFVNIGCDEEFVLAIAFLIGTFMPNGPYPSLEVGGEQGSAKSTTCRILRQMVDPNQSDLRSPPRDERDLVIAATNGHVVGFDNLSTVPDWLSDALCRIATGSGFGTRELFSDREEILFSGARPVITNGIGGLATRADLLDRTIRINCPRILRSARRPEKKLWAEFRKARPALLGALLDAVVMALRSWQSIHLDESERMSDFCHWVVAAEPALPWNPGDFVVAYQGDREGVNQAAIEASPVGEAVLQFAEGLSVPWSGRATDLLPLLVPIAGGPEVTRTLGSQWPKDGRGLSVRLRRLATNLRDLGIEIDFPGEGRRSAKSRTLTIRRSVPPSVTTVTPPQDVANGDSNDAAMTHQNQPIGEERDGCDASDDENGPFSASDWDFEEVEQETGEIDDDN